MLGGLRVLGSGVLRVEGMETRFDATAAVASLSRPDGPF